MLAKDIELEVKDEPKKVRTGGDAKLLEGVLWQERKRLWCGLPWTFTKYMLKQDKLLIRSGFLNQREDEVRLYRIKDISITRGFMQRLFSLGTIHIVSDDKTMQNFDIVNITNSYNRKEQLTSMVEEARERKRASIREVSSFDAGDSDIDEL